MSQLFVYGSLLPRQSNWYVLEPFVDDEGLPDMVPGELFDTGQGWPAAVFGQPGQPVATRVVGRVFELRAGIREHAWKLLDEFEGVHAGQYRRVEVTTQGGLVVWSYHAFDAPRTGRVESGDWAAHLAGESAQEARDATSATGQWRQ